MEKNGYKLDDDLQSRRNQDAAVLLPAYKQCILFYCLYNQEIFLIDIICIYVYLIFF